MKQLKDKVAVVTGAGSGIGRATAIALATEGCQMALSDIDDGRLQETRIEIEALGVKVSSKRLNVADKKAFHQYAEEVYKEFGLVNLVINNAGVAHAADLENTSYDDFEWLMGINFWGMVYGSKAFLPYLKKSGEGVIVNISSIMGFIAPGGSGAYNCSKFAIRGFSETLRMELDIEDCGVSCISVHPGFIKTNIFQNSRLDESMLSDYDLTQNDVANLVSKLAPTTPEKAANAIIKGIKKNKMRVLIGPDARVVDFMVRYFPQLWRKAAVLVWRKYGDKFIGSAAKGEVT